MLDTSPDMQDTVEKIKKLLGEPRNYGMYLLDTCSSQQGATS